MVRRGCSRRGGGGGGRLRIIDEGLGKGLVSIERCGWNVSLWVWEHVEFNMSMILDICILAPCRSGVCAAFLKEGNLNPQR